MGRGVVVAAALALFPAVAAAQTDSAQAVQAYRKANELAASGALTRSIPHYEKAMKLDPDLHPLAYFNLGEVYRAKGKCKKASFYFTLYGLRGEDDDAMGLAKQAIAECRGDAKWPSLSVRVGPAEGAEVWVDGHRVIRGEALEALQLPPGSYTVKMVAVDHVAAEEEVTLKEGESRELERQLEAMVFHGKLRVQANVEGATVRIFAGPSEKTELVHTGSLPLEEGVKLTEGRHFVEVTRDGYHRWIRNVQVVRDDEIVVEVTLQKQLPAAIRR